jgi:hypothetical protein
MNDDVDADPNFFEGAAEDGKGPGPHFITMSFIKDKTKIRDQLLKALASTVSILSTNIPGILIHCIQKNAKLPPLSSSTASNFPTSGMQARYYSFIQNAWSLQPGTRNKPKLPAPKIGKDGRQLFDENRGYDSPDWITSVMWISADVNIKDALLDLQMELEGDEHLQIRWKPAQKNNTKNQIIVYGLPPGFDPRGIMRELLYDLKESEKEPCNAKRFSLEQNLDQCDMALPSFNGYYKQLTPPKAPTHSQSLENSLNKNKEFMQNGCKIFHLEYNPFKNTRMDTVWTHFIESGRSELVLGRRSKIFVLPAPGCRTPHRSLKLEDI